MLRGATWRASAIVGTAVFRIVVSSDSIKNATAISHGSSRLLDSASVGCKAGASIGLGELTFVGLGGIGLRNRVDPSAVRETPIIADWLRFASIQENGNSNSAGTFVWSVGQSEISHGTLSESCPGGGSDERKDIGAGDGDRTRNQRLGKPLLYH